MVERGMDQEVVGDKGKVRAASAAQNGGEAMWAIVLSKELWRKGIWCVCSPVVSVRQVLSRSRNDAKTVSIIALGCFHPVVKVQSASLHFFLGSDEEKEDSDDESEDVCTTSSSPSTFLYASTHFQEPDVKALQHRRDINKKTRSGDKKIRKTVKTIKAVSSSL